MIVIVVVMELGSIALMNDAIDALMDAWLSQMHVSVAACGVIRLSWRVHIMTRMIQILLGVKYQWALEWISFLEWRQSNLLLTDILLSHSLLLIWCEAHIEALWAQSWTTYANWLFSTAGIRAVLSILLDRHNGFRHRLIRLRTFLLLIALDLSRWIKLLNDWVCVLGLRHILLLCLPVWWLTLLVEHVWTGSDGWISCNWARSSYQRVWIDTRPIDEGFEDTLDIVLLVVHYWVVLMLLLCI